MRTSSPLALLLAARRCADRLGRRLSDDGTARSRRRRRHRRSPIAIAVPRHAAETPAGSTAALGRQVAEVVAADLARRGLFTPVGPERDCRAIAYRRRSPRPPMPTWRGAGAAALVQGFVQANGGRHAHRRLLSLRRRRCSRAGPRRAMSSRRATGAAPRTNAPTSSIRACPARAPSSTAGSPMSPRPGPRTGGSSGSRSWIRTAPTTAS